MANTRSALKRVRQNPRRSRVNAPRRTAAKTYVGKALAVAAGGAQGDPTAALADAMSALDRAAKSGAIHPNAAARRKSRLALKMNAALGGVALEPTARARGIGKAGAAKAARARVAAAKARAETGPRTAAGKARAALAKGASGAARAETKTAGTKTEAGAKTAARTKASAGTKAAGATGTKAAGATSTKPTASARRSARKTSAGGES